MSADISPPLLAKNGVTATVDGAKVRVHFVDRHGRDLYSKELKPKDGWNDLIFRNDLPKAILEKEAADLKALLSKEEKDPAAVSRQGVAFGRRDHPFDFRSVINFRLANVHHSTCIETKKECTVGLGFEDETVADVLDPLCEDSFQNVESCAVEDCWQTGNGLIEVVRAKDMKTITGLHYLPVQPVYVNLENAKYDRHYEIIGTEFSMASFGPNRKFAKFGDLEGFIARNGGRPEEISEVIHLKRPTSMSRFYGFPDWLSAVAAIELTQCLHQYKFDFFMNRGVPEFMMFVTGGELGTDDWAAIQTATRAHIGLGNSHKTLAINIPNPNIKVEVVKLGIEGGKDAEEFATSIDTLALQIVSAHRVPPLLAGIQIPGKLGASNELTNALLAFDTLVCGPAQTQIQTTLGNTLGKEKLSGLGLKKKQLKHKTIADNILSKLAQPGAQAMSTVGGMRQGLPEAQAEGRDLSAGLKKMMERVENMSPTEIGDVYGHIMSTILGMSKLRAGLPAPV